MPGRVVAVNLAHVIDTPVPGRGEHRDTKPTRTGIDKRPVEGPVRVEPLGVVGDSILDTAHHGGLDQAVYAYALEDQQWWTDGARRRADPADHPRLVRGEPHRLRDRGERGAAR